MRTSTQEPFETYSIGKALGIYTDEELIEIERRPKIKAAGEPPAPADDVT